MKTIIKVLSVMLSIILLFGVITINANSATYSGECGSQTTWTLNTDSGLLTINGSGGLSSSDWHFPWYDYRESIRTINIAYGVTRISNYAFGGCTNLTSITIPDSVTSIDWQAFSDCRSLKSIRIPSSVTEIKYNTFERCSSLSSVFIPNSVTKIGKEAFYGCTSLSSVLIPDSVTEIADSAFKYCKSLLSVVIPNSVSYLGESVFCNCSNLSSVTISNRVTSLHYKAFAYCPNLIEITIPDSMKYLGNYIFMNDTKLESVILGRGVTTIDVATFCNCSSLKRIALGNNITSIGSCAFQYCDNLEDVYYSGTTDQWKRISIMGLNENLTNANIHYNYAGLDSLEKEPVTQSSFIPKSPDFSIASFENITIPFYCSYINNPSVAIEWNNNLFGADSISWNYDKRIDTIGAALSAAAEGKNSSDGSFIKAAYEKLGVNTSNISLYSYSGSTYNEKEATNEDGDKFAEDDNLAFSIAYKDITDCYDNKLHLIFITARGTQTAQEIYMDWAQSDNGSVLGYKTYDFYTDFYKDISAGLKHFIKKHNELKTGNVKLLISGHSLGGAAANLIAADLSKNTSSYGLHYGRADVFAYTYGACSPLVNSGVNTFNYNNIFNTFNYLDSFGPHGNGAAGQKPKGYDNYEKKFGKIRDYKFDFEQVYFRYKKDFWGNTVKEPLSSTINHDMPGYIAAVQNCFADKKEYSIYQCPVDIEFVTNGNTVGRIKNNVIDENVTSIPCAVIGDAKMFTIDSSASYEIKYIGTDFGSMNIVFGNTAIDGETKEFTNITLEKGKTMSTIISANGAINDYSVYVTDKSGNITAEIDQNGSEKKITIWQRIIKWFKNMIQRLKELFK